MAVVPNMLLDNNNNIQCRKHNNQTKLRANLTEYIEANPKKQKNVPYKKFLTYRSRGYS